MLLLAVDTALAACSAALLSRGVSGERVTLRRLDMARGHGEALMPLLQDLMAEAGCAYRDIDRFAVTVGPGTFTGVRVGVAAVRGLALATGRPASGVTTLAALAATAREAGVNVPLVAAIDARRGEVYAQAFDAAGRPLDRARAAASCDVVAALPAGVAVAFGSGAPALADAAGAVGRGMEVAGTDAAPDAAALARLAADGGGLQEPRPVYLRPADAKPQSAAAIARR